MTFTTALGFFFLLVAAGFYVASIVVRLRRRAAANYARSFANHPAGTGIRRGR